MNRAHSKRKYKNREGTIHCAPTIKIQIKTINLYFHTNDKMGENNCLKY
jgi:hypothetical protein